MLLLVGVPTPFPFDLIQNYQISYTTPATGPSDVTLTWALTQPADRIIVLRGGQLVDTLPGTATTWTTQEANYGEYQYTIGWVKWNMTFQWQTDILYLGRLSWDPPAGNAPDGYIIFVASDPSAFTDPLPTGFEVAGGGSLFVTLGNLIDAGFLQTGTEQYFAAASYVDIGGERFLSELTDHIQDNITFTRILIDWAPPQKPGNHTIGW